MPRVGFEPTIPAFQRTKTVDALDSEPTEMATRDALVRCKVPKAGRCNSDHDQTNLAVSPNEGCDSRRNALQMMMMMMICPLLRLHVAFKTIMHFPKLLREMTCESARAPVKQRCSGLVQVYNSLQLTRYNPHQIVSRQHNQYCNQAYTTQPSATALLETPYRPPTAVFIM
jgi:hypothetical protein